MKTLILSLFIIGIVYSCVIVLPNLVHSLRRKIIMKLICSKKRHNSLTSAFLTEAHPGKSFVTMIGIGLLRSIKTINHGADYPDDRQRDTFKHYGTKEIMMALEEIGEGV